MKNRKSPLLVLAIVLSFVVIYSCVTREPFNPTQSFFDFNVPVSPNTQEITNNIPEIPSEKKIEQEIKILKNKTLSRKELQCISDMVYHESRGEGIQGQIAVTHVVLNRMENDEFPKDACEVIYQKKGKTCQYSWVCGKYKNVSFRKSDEYNDIKLLVKTVTSIPDRHEVDPTYGALYFKRYDVKDKWFRTLSFKTRVGKHSFYA